MAGERDAKVRLNLAAAGFLSMMNQLQRESAKLAKELEGIGEESKKTEGKLHPFLQSAKKGLGAARSAAAELGNTLKSTLSTALTLGGALSLGKAISDSADLRDEYKNLAFAIRAGTGAAMQWEQVQQTVEGTANRWKRSNQEVTQTYKELFGATGDVEFAKRATDEISKVATATGAAIDPLRTLAGQLKTKFDIGGNELADTLAHMVQLSNQGGVSLEQLGAVIGQAGASAKLMNLEGREGLQKVVGMLNIATSSSGDLQKSLSGVVGVMDRLTSLGDQRQIADVERKLGVKLTADDGSIRKDAVEAIAQATGGQREVLAKVFSGEQLKFLTDFGAIYGKAFDEAQGTFKERSEAASKAFAEAVKRETKQRIRAADIEKQAADKLTDPKQRLQDAINKFTNAFQKPQVIKAIETMADKLPIVAEALAKVVEFAADHPILAGGAALGAKPAMAFAGSMTGDMFGSMAKGTGKTIAKDFKAAAAKGGTWAAVGRTFATVAVPVLVGLLVTELGKMGIDKRIKDKEKSQNDIVVAGVHAHAAAKSGDLDRMKKEEENLKAKIAQMEKDQSGFSGAFDTFMGGLVTIMPKALGGDPNFVSPEQQMLFEARQELKDLQQAMAKGAGSGDKAADALDKAAKAAASAATAFERLGRSAGSGGTGTNGLPPRPPTGSGSGV